MKIEKILSIHAFFNNKCDWCAREITGKVVMGSGIKGSFKHYCSKKCKSEAER